MSVWVEDAQVLTDTRELSRSQKSVLLKTADVSEFLSNPSVSSCAIVAPKGFGKTLVLKLKRMSLQECDYKCFPLSPIVDRPKDRPPILPTEILNLLEKSDNWETLWQLALSICLIKGFRDDEEVKNQLHDIQREIDQSPTLGTIFTHRHIDTPFDILHNCISAQRNEIFNLIRVTHYFTRIFSRVHQKAAIFVDNIDEYLIHYINFAYLRRSDVHQNFLHLWHAGQIGAWLAVRRLQGINPHVRIFISIRKEAYHFAAKHEPDFSNLRSFRRELRYNRSDIQQIIENNIAAEAASKLADRRNASLILRFVGPANQYISNSGTAKQESVLDYWIRHCSLRPRDAVAIGGEISSLPPGKRSQNAVRTAINASAAERVQTLFSEVAPFFESLYPDILPRVIKSNVLKRDALIEATQEYARIAADQFELDPTAVPNPFCALYSMGLLGIVQQSRDHAQMLIQVFAQAGAVPFGSVELLPHAEIYVIHPALSDFIIQRNVDFLRAMSKHNVVGDNLEWRPEENIRFVAMGDIGGYRAKIMQNVGKSQTFDKFWTELFRQFTENLDYARINSGDSLTIADRSPARLLLAARALMRRLADSGYGLKMKIGAHSGFWRINQNEDGVAHPEISDIVGVAARIEPIARPGDILVSQQFLEHAEHVGFDMSREAPQPVDANYVGADIFSADDGVLISKKGKEAEQRVRLYRLAG